MTTLQTPPNPHPPSYLNSYNEGKQERFYGNIIPNTKLSGVSGGPLIGVQNTGGSWNLNLIGTQSTQISNDMAATQFAPLAREFKKLLVSHLYNYRSATAS